MLDESVTIAVTVTKARRRGLVVHAAEVSWIGFVALCTLGHATSVKHC